MLNYQFNKEVSSAIPAVRVTLSLVFVVAFLTLPVSPLLAKAISTEYQYAVKLVCSGLLPHQDGDLVRGIYRTAVNIHNPTEEKVPFAFKVAVSGGVNVEPSDFSVTRFRDATLVPDGAVEITCFDAFGFFCPTPDGICIDFAFLNGFLVLKTPVELDVVGVYTARPTDGEVETIEVETIIPRKVKTEIKPSKDRYEGEIKKRMPYPEKPAGDYGKQICGGIAAIPCPKGKVCTDDPSDSCDPEQGGADCPGICVKEIATKKSR